MVTQKWPFSREKKENEGTWVIPMIARYFNRLYLYLFRLGEIFIYVLFKNYRLEYKESEHKVCQLPGYNMGMTSINVRENNRTLMMMIDNNVSSQHSNHDNCHVWHNYIGLKYSIHMHCSPYDLQPDVQMQIGPFHRHCRYVLIKVV